MPSRVSAWSVYDVFTLADDEQLFIGAVSDKQFQTLCEVIDRPDLAEDAALATNAQRVAVRPELLKWLGRHAAPPPHRRALRRSSKPPACRTRRSCAPTSWSTTRTSCRAAAWSTCRPTTAASTKVVLLPLLMGGRRPGVRQPLPKIGEHTDEVLAALHVATSPPASPNPRLETHQETP